MRIVSDKLIVPVNDATFWNRVDSIFTNHKEFPGQEADPQL